MPSHYSKIQFPLWKYLNQPLFDRECPLVLHPRRFWYLYKIELLERCFAHDCASTDYRAME